MKNFLLLIIPVMMISCGQESGKNENKADSSVVRLITVDPGHFHAALVQKTMYEGVSPDVNVYAPEGPDVQQHLERIKAYNTRAENPASWNEIVYTGPDFFEKMLQENAGNVVVLSGNNGKKAEYIIKSVNVGLNVLSDKPMIIKPEDFPALEAAFKTASEKGVLLYDIMTERYEITTILQKLLSLNTEVFGTLQKGTRQEPAVSKISVHHFSKLVSGIPLKRPVWYFDVEQQGEGIVDVTTHLVDLVQWECFPEQILNPSDVTMISARRWPTQLSAEDFKNVTGSDSYPDFLMKDVKDGKLNVFANGEMIYKIKDVFAKVSVEWHFMPPAGAGDTHYSIMRGTNCDLVIKQGPDEKYVPTLYIENIKENSEMFSKKLANALASLPYDSITFAQTGKSLRLSFPGKYRVSHEEHFGQVMTKYLGYLKSGKMPDWEVPAMITKYYTTTSALKMAKGK
ncbi:MAG TPA: putative oxidoreductase C-terminal domain-containing protein [Bacteroidales bacterium]|nr:putative oxidoreductase C-terminal domain-containing protein [Bacteroidales bacterium]